MASKMQEILGVRSFVLITGEIIMIQKTQRCIWCMYFGNFGLIEMIVKTL